MKAPIAGVLLAVFICGATSGRAALITFEEIGAIPGGSGTLVFPGSIGQVQTGSLGVFDTTVSNLAHMSVSGPNAGFLERAVDYSFSLTGGEEFTFVGAAVARSHSDSSFFRFTGWRDSQLLFSVDTSEYLLTFPYPFFFALNWQDVDRITVLWAGPGAPAGIASLDNFTYEVTSISEPSVLMLLLLGLIVISCLRLIDERSQSAWQLGSKSWIGLVGKPLSSNPQG